MEQKLIYSLRYYTTEEVGLDGITIEKGEGWIEMEQPLNHRYGNLLHGHHLSIYCFPWVGIGVVKALKLVEFGLDV